MHIGPVEGIAIVVIIAGTLFSLRHVIQRIIDFRFPKSK
jgi:hypothetical protein